MSPTRSACLESRAESRCTSKKGERSFVANTRAGAFLSLSLSDVAAPQSFAPARLSSLADKEDLTCPADEPSTVIFCQAVVEETGAVASVQETSCFADKRSDSRRAEVLRSKVLQSESVAVDELGRASDVKVEMNAFAPERNVQLAVQALEQSRFIPAFVEGRPHFARYFELMHVRDP